MPDWIRVEPLADDQLTRVRHIVHHLLLQSVDLILGRADRGEILYLAVEHVIKGVSGLRGFSCRVLETIGVELKLDRIVRLRRR